MQNTKEEQCPDHSEAPDVSCFVQVVCVGREAVDDGEGPVERGPRRDNVVCRSGVLGCEVVDEVEWVAVYKYVLSVMDLLSFEGGYEWEGQIKVPHDGANLLLYLHGGECAGGLFAVCARF